MKRTILSWHDFEDQAAAILAASKAKRGDGLRMEDVEGDEDADAPDDGDADDEDDADEDDDSDDADDDKDADGKKDDKKDSDKGAEDDKVDRAEYERVKRHRAAADRRVAERDATIADLQKQLRDKDTKADGTVQARVTELESATKKQDKTIHELRIQNAFLAANTYDWVDPSDALRLADLSAVEIDPEDGSVTGLKEALKKLATAKPHLIKSRKEGDRNPSGGPNNGKRKGSTKKIDRATLAQNYPVLRAQR